MGKALLVVIVFALVVYGVLRLVELRRARRSGGGPVRPAPPRRPLGPDDDPTFLRDLEQRRRREQHEREQRGEKKDGPKRNGESEAS